jgi:hypothetical protein
LEKERKKTKEISDFNLNDCMTSDGKVTEFSASSRSPCFVSRADRIIEFLGVGLEISTLKSSKSKRDASGIAAEIAALPELPWQF